MIITKLAQKVFGTKNDREVRKYLPRVEEINALEEEYEKLSDEELKGKFQILRESLNAGEKTLNEVLIPVFAIVREVSKRTLNMRHFDVQLIGGMVLHEGKIAEMKTGEGKTLVATLPVVLNAMLGKGVHVVTVNDYLAKRDAEQMSAIYNFLGLSVGTIVSGEYNDVNRKAQYDADITYGTNNEFGFDYLRDNMKFDLLTKVQREHNFVIVDEVDSILIDEARTPLIISGPTNKTLDGYIKANAVALKLKQGKAPEDPRDPSQKPTGDFIVDEKNRTVILTEEGINKAEKFFEVDNLYSLENAVLSHYLDQALKANYLFKRDVDYIVRENEIVIVDEFTGRLSEGRRFSEGLHQALEAKEGVKIQQESQTLADITYQNYFRLYKKIAGMTGTAQTEATEFAQIYKLDVLSIPTNLEVIRVDHNDLIFKSEGEKLKAVIDEIKKVNAKGQPILVGTASIEKSEQLHKLLKEAKIPHTVLNAKNHEKEAEIIKDAGLKGAVTIATNMAGRGVDIKIDDEVKKLGGLYILGTERHESRRIDNQLRGRGGRQGDPGVSKFFLSLEDNLLRIFGSDRIKLIMEKLGIEEGESIESKLVTRAIENAQKKVENLHFESRKHVLEYDDVANEQRKTIYNYRNELLSSDLDLREKLNSYREEYVTALCAECEILNGALKEEFNLEKLSELLKSEVNLDLPVEKLENLNYDEIVTLVQKELEEAYERKMSTLELSQRREIENLISLQILDRAWREHLYQMDILKTGIGLRGYNQKDPLSEYKKESYDLFMELVARLKFDTIKTLQAIQFRVQDIEKEEENLREEIKKDDEELLAQSRENHQNDASHFGGTKKPARNEACPCGSGKKYKNCCGKSGPKKGEFAKKN